MNIRVIREADLEESLLSSGHTHAQLDQAENLICETFEQCATLIFQQTLGEPCPDRIEVGLVRVPVEENGGDVKGEFFPLDSTAEKLVFKVYESAVKDALSNDMTMLRYIVMHELSHAIDLTELQNNQAILIEIQNKVKDYLCQQDAASFFGLKPYYDTLKLLAKYRNEGIAILVSTILVGDAVHTQESHKRNLEIFSQITGGIFSQFIPEIDTMEYLSAYEFAPNVLLEVLSIRSDIDDDLKGKIKRGMESGRYDLNKEDICALVNKCRNLSLTSYIEALILTDREEKSLVPIESFLHFCSRLPLECSEDITAFREMVDDRDRISEQVFTETIQNFMHETYTPWELKRKYKKFCRKADEQELQFKPKIDRLYQAFASLPDGDLKNLIQWALTYFFADMDLISDDIPIYGLVDDMIVIDIVLKILDRRGEK